MSDDSHEAATPADEEPVASTEEEAPPADGDSEGGEAPTAPADDAGENAEGTAAPGTADDEDASAGAAAVEGESLTARVAQHDEDLAKEVAALREENARLDSETEDLRADLEDARGEVEDLTSRLKRVQADFQNYKKRQEKRKQQLRERATESFVESLVPVRDNLVRALDQDEDADIREGVQKTLEEFDRVLAEENVEPIEPAPGDEVDPKRYEVMMRVASDHPEGTVASVYQPGYEMGDRVVRAAQITVSEGADGEE